MRHREPLFQLVSRLSLPLSLETVLCWQVLLARLAIVKAKVAAWLLCSSLAIVESITSLPQCLTTFLLLM